MPLAATGCILFTDLGSLSADGANATAADAGDGAVTTSADAADAAPCVTIPGMTAHLTFDSATVDGGRALDVSGNAAHGKFDGPPISVVPGHIGEALQFPPNDAHVDVPDVAIDNAAGGRNAVSFWYYRAYEADESDYIFVMRSVDFIALYLSGARLCFNTGIGDCHGTDNVPLYDRWVHVVAVFANGAVSEREIYVDGKKRTLRCSPGMQPGCQGGVAAAPLRIGGDREAPFRGIIDDVRVFRRPLSEAEVTALHEGRACP